MPNTWLALLHCKLHRRPILLWETSTPHPPGWFKQLLMPIIRSFFRTFDGAFAASSACKGYLISMGARPDKVMILPQAIDSTHFGREVDRARERRDETKKLLGIRTSYVIIYCGRFVPGKGLIQLLEAFARIAEILPDVSLMYVGDGPLRQELVDLAKTYGLAERVIVHPYVPAAELPMFYALADVFVLYSWYDTFGVVVAEAMASGLPIVTTPNVGAVQDLVFDGVNGLIVDYDDEVQLIQALKTLLTDHSQREKMGRQSRQIISGWSLDTSARNFATLVMDYMPWNADNLRDTLEK